MPLLNPRTAFVILVSLYTFYFMNRVARTSKNVPLTKGEKIQVILLLIFNTLISWAILSFGWKEKLPLKAAQVNRYLRNIVFTLIALAVISIIITITLTAPNRGVKRTAPKTHAQ